MTDQQKQIALEVALEMNTDPKCKHLAWIEEREAIEFSARYLEAIAKQSVCLRQPSCFDRVQLTMRFY